VVRRSAKKFIPVIAATILAGCGTALTQAKLQGSSELSSYAQSQAAEIARLTGGNTAELAKYIAENEALLAAHAKERRAMPAGSEAPVSGTQPDAGKLTLPASKPFSSNQVEVIINADRVFAAAEEAIRNAKYRIQADLFMLGGKIGSRLASLMEERRQAGVDVRIILDSHFAAMGPANQQSLSTATFLRDHQMPVRTFPLDDLLMPKGAVAKASLIDHNKLLVTDDIGFVGCANLIDVADTNHDLWFKVRGPVVAELSQWLDETWNKSDPVATWQTKDSPKPRELPAPTWRPSGIVPDGPAGKARLTRTDRTEQSTYERFLARIKSSTKIDVGVFELDDTPLKTEIIAAHKRGAKVRVLMDRHQVDYKYTGKKMPVGIPNLLAVRDFLAAGIEVHWFDPIKPLEEMHLKYAIFDDNVALVGSTNFTTKAFLYFRETGLELEGGPVMKDMVNLFEDDWRNHSTPVKTLTAQQRALASTIAFLNKSGIGWW
jgi:phosphatidylserine/phosphatidylglycerophosphate/cardiolipin synthase-like enzyme